MSFEAKYYGRCTGCDEPIHPGDPVQYDEQDRLLHADCTDDRDHTPRTPSEVACPGCFLIHVGECA